MIVKIFVKLVFFIVSWFISGIAFFIALFSACVEGKVHERMIGGSLVFYRFIVSTGQVFAQSRDIKKVTDAVSLTFGEIMNRLAQNVQADYKQVAIVFISSYLFLKVFAGLMSILRRRIKIRGGRVKSPPASKTPFNQVSRADLKNNNVDPGDKTILTTGGY